MHYTHDNKKIVLVTQKVDEIIKVHKYLDNYCGYIYLGEEMNPNVRELLLLTAQTKELQKVIGFHKNITSSEEFKEMIDYYHINLDDIKLLEFDVNPLKLSTEQEIEFKKKFEDIMNSIEPHVVKEEIISDFQIQTHRPTEHKSFKEGLRHMFDRKQRF